MEQVRRAAGVSNGSLYHHFRTRAELVARLVLEDMTQAQQIALEALRQAADVEGGVRALVRSFPTSGRAATSS